MSLLWEGIKDIDVSNETGSEEKLDGSERAGQVGSRGAWCFAYNVDSDGAVKNRETNYLMVGVIATRRCIKKFK